MVKKRQARLLFRLILLLSCTGSLSISHPGQNPGMKDQLFFDTPLVNVTSDFNDENQKSKVNKEAVMAIFLAQHGLSLPKDQDHEKGLSDKGRADTIRIAEVARAYKIPVSKIVHSAKKRAEQTAVIFNETLGVKNPCERIDGINPLDDVTLFANMIDPQSNEMVVGHLPFMERLVSHLITGTKDLRVYKFQNSGIVCLENEDGDWFIKWTLNPNIS